MALFEMCDQAEREIVELGGIMEWQPIEIYDSAKEKPKNAVFYYRATDAMKNGSYLMPTIQTTRIYGQRVCTHFIALPSNPLETME